MTIENMLRHIEEREADFGFEVEDVADGKSLPVSAWPSTVESVAFAATVIMCKDRIALLALMDR